MNPEFNETEAMQGLDIDRLIYRRQYILTSGEITCPYQHRRVNIDHGFQLLVHPDLLITQSSNQDKQLILLGDIYDHQTAELTNQDILDGFLALSLEEIVKRITRLAGRYVFIYSDQHTLTILHDASAARKVFYTNVKGLISCSSNQHLLAEVFGILPSDESSVVRYYQSEEFKKNFYSNIGDTSYYSDIKQLLPNHLLDIKNSEIKRFWPSEALEPVTNEACAAECASILKGFVSAASKRYSLMIPVSSGYDSRTILAASKDIRNDVMYYLNDSEVVRSTADGWIPQKILADQDLEFHLLKIEDRAGEDFKEAYRKNNRLANPEYVDIIYNYYINHQEKLNLPGAIIPIVKSLYHASSKNITGKKLAGLHGYDKYQFAIDFYDNWLSDAREVCEKSNTNIYDLLFQEDRTCNWGTQIQLDKDIAQEDFLAYNSAYLISRMLTFEKSRRQNPHYELHKGIINELWPQLLHYPFNPSTRNRIKQLFSALGLYHPIRKIKKLLLGS